MFSEEQEASNGYLASFHAEAFRLHVNCFPFHSFVLSPAITSNNRKRIVKCFPIFIWSHNKKAKNRKKNPQDTTNGNRMKCCNNFSLAVFFLLLAVRRISNIAYYLCIFAKRFSLAKEGNSTTICKSFQISCFYIRATLNGEKKSDGNISRFSVEKLSCTISNRKSILSQGILQVRGWF